MAAVWTRALTRICVACALECISLVAPSWSAAADGRGVPADVSLVRAAFAFSEGSGTVAADSSGYGNSARLTGPATWTSAGKYGGALRLGGGRSGARIPAADSLKLSQGVAIEAWAFPRALSGPAVLVEREGRGGSVAYAISVVSNGAATTTITTTTGTYVVTSARRLVRVKTWVHVAATFDGSSLRLFVNGVDVGSTPASGLIVASAKPLWIGRSGTGAGALVGTLDEVRLYGRALSIAEIRTDMSTPSDAPPTIPEVSSPEFSISGGEYVEPQFVAMTTRTPNATIRYTTDGSDPLEDSMVVNGPVAVTRSLTLKARAWRGGYTPSAVAAQTYTIAIDTTPPTITASLSPPPNGAGWQNLPATATFTCEDASGISSCSSPVVLTQDGAGWLASGTAIDNAGNTSAIAVTVNIDTTKPTVIVDAPLNAEESTDAATIVHGAISDSLSGIQAVTCNGSPGTIDGTSFLCTVPLSAGTNQIIVQVSDVAGNVSSTLLRVVRTDVDRTAIVVTPTTRSMVVGETKPLRAVDQSGVLMRALSWTSADSTIARVTQSMDGSFSVAGVTPGATIVTVSDGMLSAEARVDIYAGPFLPAGTSKWTFVPRSSGFNNMLLHQSTPEDAEQVLVGFDAGGTIVASGISNDGDQLWSVPLSGWPVFSDVYGGVISPLGSSIGVVGLSRAGGPGVVPWTYESWRPMEYGSWAQSPDGTIFFLEDDPQPPSGPFVDLVAIDGTTGVLKSRVSLPRAFDCLVGELPPSGHTHPFVGTDGAAYVGGSVTVTDCGYSNNRNHAYLLRMDAAGNSSIDIVRSAETEEVNCGRIDCFGTWSTFGIGEVKPDGQGGVLIAGATQVAEFDERGRRDGPSTQWVLRKDAGVLTEWASTGYGLTLIARDNVVFAQTQDGWASFEASTGVRRASFDLGTYERPLKAIPGGELLTYDPLSSMLMRRDASGVVVEADRVPVMYNPEITAADEVVSVAYDPDSGQISVAKYAIPPHDDATLASAAAEGDIFGHNAARPDLTGIFLRGHVIFPVLSRRHSYVRMVPENQAYWIDPARNVLARWFTPKLNGLYFATLGAEASVPPCSGRLKSDVDRSTPTNDGDVATLPIDSQRLQVAKAMEDSTIGLLFNRDGNFHDDEFEYFCVPALLPGSRNSNSYTHGLLNAAGIPGPDSSFPTDLYPGWDQPIPEASFDPH